MPSKRSESSGSEEKRGGSQNAKTLVKAEVFVGSFENPEKGLFHCAWRDMESFMEEETIELYFEKLEVCKACRTWGKRQRAQHMQRQWKHTHICVWETKQLDKLEPRIKVRNVRGHERRKKQEYVLQKKKKLWLCLGDEEWATKRPSTDTGHSYPCFRHRACSYKRGDKESQLMI